MFIARRHLPGVPLSVIANRRLKEVVDNLHEKSESPMAGPDHVGDRVFGGEARSRHLLLHAVPGIGNREAASRRCMNELARGLDRCCRNGTAHSCFAIVGNLLRVTRHARVW